MQKKKFTPFLLLHSEKIGNKETQHLLLVVKKFDFLHSTFLFHHIPKEQCIANNIPPPHALRFFEQSI